MDDKKRYYWIKLKENFFDLETIDWLISQKNGCEYIVLYQKLCLLTANKGGNLETKIGEMLIPYDVNKIARDTKFNVDTVIVAMELFKKIGLIYELESGILHIPYVNELVGSETSSAKRVREHRKRKALQCNTECNNNVTQEKEYRVQSIESRDLEIDTEVEAESTASGDSDYSDPEHQLKSFCEGIMLTDKQTEDLLQKMDLETFDFYIAKMKNYPNIKNHYATMLKWYNEDRKVSC